MPWKVLKFRRSNGECPVDDWLGSKEVSPRDRAAIDSRMRQIMQIDGQLPGGWVIDYVTTSLQRLERKAPNNKAVRFLCERDDAAKTIVLFNGMLKKNKELPKVMEAQRLQAEYRQDDGSTEDYEFD
jgi:hypothetical protein